MVEAIGVLYQVGQFLGVLGVEHLLLRPDPVLAYVPECPERRAGTNVLRIADADEGFKDWPEGRCHLTVVARVRIEVLAESRVSAVMR